MHLRVSASDIDALRYYLAHDDADLSALIAQLRKETPQTPSMAAGTALHAALETCSDGEFTELSANGYTFELACSGEIDLPTIREVKATKDYFINDCSVTLVGKVDAIHGRRVDDHKFTSRFDAERFLSSYQWKIYLDIFGADEFRWNIFEGRQDSQNPQNYAIYGFHKLTVHRYPDMTWDVVRALGQFVDFAREYLPERFETSLPSHNAMMAQLKKQPSWA
jgi:hypothetical protein